MKQKQKEALAKKDNTAAELDAEIATLKANIDDRMKEIDFHKAQLSS